METDKILTINEKEFHTYDEAIEKAGNGKFQRVVLLLFALSVNVVVLEGFNMSHVLPAAKCDIDITNYEQALIGSVNFIGVVLSSHFWGFTADMWGRKKVLRLCYLMVFVFVLLSSLAVSSTMLFITRLCVGLCISSIQPSILTYLGEFHCNKNRVKYVSLITVFTAFTSIAQPLLGLLIIPMEWKFEFFNGYFIFAPWRLYLLLLNSLSLISFVLINFLPESPKFLLSVGKHDEAISVLNKIHDTNYGKEKDMYSVVKVHLDEDARVKFSDVNGFSGAINIIWTHSKALFLQPYLGNMVLLGSHLFVIYGMSYGVGIWLPQVFAIYGTHVNSDLTICDAITLAMHERAKKLIPLNITYSTTMSPIQPKECAFKMNAFSFQMSLLIGVVIMFTNLSASKAMIRIGKYRVIIPWILACALCSIALMFTSYFYINVALIGFVITSATSATMTISMAADLFPTQYKSMALSLILMTGLIGAIVGTNTAGVLLQKHCHYLLNMFAIVLLLCLISAYLILRKIDKIKK